MGTSVAATSVAQCASASSRVTEPSRRPSVAAKPPLVVASALNPIDSSSFALPTSQGFGISSGRSLWWRSRKCEFMERTLPTLGLRAMTRSNREVVIANSKAFSRRDIDAMMEFFAPDAVVRDRRAVGWGEFDGADAVRAYYEGLFDNTDAIDEDLTVVSE